MLKQALCELGMSALANVCHRLTVQLSGIASPVSQGGNPTKASAIPVHRAACSVRPRHRTDQLRTLMEGLDLFCPEFSYA